MRKKHAAFTLIEMVTVITIIVILAGLVVAVIGYVNRKAAMTRALNEIEMLKLACQNYKAETGGYPQDTNSDGYTDKLNPKTDFNPTNAVYLNAGKYLYKELTGDKTGSAGEPDGVPEDGEQIYFKESDQRMLKVDKDAATGKITRVYYFWDPFGYPYGYSTAALREEQIYQKAIKAWITGAQPKRLSGDNLPGFNISTFDLWSTVGNKTTPAVADREAEQKKWIKNW